MFETVDDHEIRVALGQGQRMTLTSGTIVSSCSHLVYNRLQLFLRSLLFRRFSIQKHKEPKDYVQ